MPPVHQYPIAAVARLTGLSIDTLRAWERRYGAVTPQRDANGRVYRARDVQRLKQLAALVAQGHAISRIAKLTPAALNKLGGEAQPVERSNEAVDIAPLLTALRRYDIGRIDAMLTRLATIVPADTFTLSVALPVLRSIGEQWEASAVRPSHEHLVSASLRSLLGGLLRTAPRRPRASTIVVAAPAGERHELGGLAAAVLAAHAGLHVVYLGADLPARDIVHAVHDSDARAVIVSATTAGAVEATEWRFLTRMNDSVDVWVGGPQSDAARAAARVRLKLAGPLDDLATLFERYA